MQGEPKIESIMAQYASSDKSYIRVYEAVWKAFMVAKEEGPCFSVGKYTFSKNGDVFFLGKEGAGAMGLSEEVLDKIWKENF